MLDSLLNVFWAWTLIWSLGLNTYSHTQMYPNKQFYLPIGIVSMNGDNAGGLPSK